ncbi:hypothetical protein SAMD00019534_117130 [Acytostelium subglobosum LB1]|uniref:hypothetical protein n=1 Tax=Acytostelium subglobosum LB1 TaxID=1410327 RepID=UPI00064495F0|nr:hypothetical protein SAMD00019534_117130 [Acytostelium subglobosum LB1]GAM28537.1 hypothetical protein SAMD00019534_117130 [Acytostelium subglobosum LB1]|eukprot:XP_012748576.1 hypothetical protein SAMD00019534_117130 [Acytostelium subglobosum LB1]
MLDRQDEYDHDFNERLGSLWATAKPLVQSLPSFIQDEATVTEYFRGLHNQLMLQEHKILAQFKQQKEATESTLRCIIEEVKMTIQVLAETRSKTHRYLPNDQQHCVGDDEAYDSDEAMANLLPIVNSLQTAHSLDDFVSIITSKCLVPVSPAQEEVNLVLLLDGIDTMKKKSLVPPTKLAIRTDENMVSMLKLRLQDCFQLVDMSREDQAKSRTTIVSYTSNGRCHLFDTMNNTWSDLGTDDKGRPFTYHSIVAVRDMVYVMGGDTDSKTFSRFCMTTRKFDNIGQLNNHCGFYVSACYDGDQYIYLVGGIFKSDYSTKVSRMSIRSFIIEDVCSMVYSCAGTLTFIKDGLLYIVGGYLGTNHRRSLRTINLKTHEEKTVMEDLTFNKSIISSCYDGNDMVYILDSTGHFFRVCVSMREKTVLAGPPFPATQHHSFVYMPSPEKDNNDLVYFFGGNKIGTRCYSVRENHWTDLGKDNADRIYCGAVLVETTRAGTTTNSGSK